MLALAVAVFKAGIFHMMSRIRLTSNADRIRLLCMTVQCFISKVPRRDVCGGAMAQAAKSPASPREQRVPPQPVHVYLRRTGGQFNISHQ